MYHCHYQTHIVFASWKMWRCVGHKVTDAIRTVRAGASVTLSQSGPAWSVVSATTISICNETYLMHNANCISYRSGNK